jgi:hypothetical protein
MESIENIFNKYPTDKGPSFHNYSRQYGNLIHNYRLKNTKYLEFGVFNGGSLNAMRDVLPLSDCILGLDIVPEFKKNENPEKKIYVEIGDASRSEFLKSIKEKYGTFDIILDDGSHINRDVCKSFEYAFINLLNDDGLYIVEDTICYKNSQFIDSAYENHLNYFTRFLHHLNQWRYDSHEGIKDNCVDPFKIMKKTSDPFEYSIDKIEFGVSYIAIHKKIRHHWIKKSDIIG